MLINQFDGGQNSRLAPHMIGQNQAVSYVNIDEEPGTLKSLKDKLLTNIETSQFAKYYDFGKRFISFPIFTSFVNYNNDMLYCNEAGSGRIRGDADFSLGISNPTTAGVGTAFPVSKSLRSVTVSGTTSVTTTHLPKIDLHYVLVNTSGSSRSLGLKFTVKADDSTQNLKRDIASVDDDTFIINTASEYKTLSFSAPSADIASSGVEVYRFYLGKYRLVGLILPGVALIDSTYQIPGANRVLTDADFASLKGTYQYLLTYYNPSTGAESGASPVSPEYSLPGGGSISFINLPSTTEAERKRIYRIGGVLSNFALIADLPMATTSFVDNIPDNKIDGRILNSADYLPAPAGMTFIEQSSGMVFGAVGTKVRFTPPGKPDAWPASYEIPFESTVTGLAEVSNGILVFTAFKTYLLVGTGPTTIAKVLVDSAQGCLSGRSIQKLAGSAIWVSSDGICISSGGPAQVVSRDSLGKIAIDAASSVVHDDRYYVLDSKGETYVFSFAYGGIFKRLQLDISSFATGSDVLYGWKNGFLYQLFAADEYLNFEYLSPKFIEGRLSEIKAYKKFYFFANGDIIINILINDRPVVEQVKLKSGDTVTIQPPQELQRGNYVQFKITGKGELLEYEYEVSRRDG